MCVFGWCARVGELRFSCVDVGCKSCRVTSWKGINHLLRISCDHRLLGAFFAFATRTSHEYGTRWTGMFSYTSDIWASYYMFSLGAVISNVNCRHGDVPACHGSWSWRCLEMQWVDIWGKYVSIGERNEGAADSRGISWNSFECHLFFLLFLFA